MNVFVLELININRRFSFPNVSILRTLHRAAKKKERKKNPRPFLSC